MKQLRNTFTVNITRCTWSQLEFYFLEVKTALLTEHTPPLPKKKKYEKGSVDNGLF
jgi:hypothetical protein